MYKFTNYIDDLNDYINKNLSFNDPNNLYDPVKYILQNGGKKELDHYLYFLYQIFFGKIDNALPAAASIEIFHNFTLVHDDIMDDIQSEEAVRL